MPEDTESQEKLIKLDKMFNSALEHPTWVSWRKNAEQCFKYREGDQWTAEELSELKSRNRPPTVNNQVKVTLDRMTGQFVKQRTRIGYRGRNIQDEPVARTLTDVFLFIKQNTGLEYEEREMAEDGFTSGFGVLETYVDFNDLFQPELKIRQEDCFNIFPDPFSRRYDWNQDANFICRAKWLDLDEAEALYPSHKSDLRGLIAESYVGLIAGQDAFKKDNYIDEKRRRIRIVECWYKTRERQILFLYPNGKTVPGADLNKREAAAARKEAKQIDRVKERMRVAIFTSGVLLDDRESPHDHDLFPFVPYFVHRKKSGEPYSLVFTALSLQDVINKRESKAVHLLNVNQAIFNTNSIRDKVELAEQMAKPDGQIEIRGKYGEDFFIEKNIDLAATQFELHREAKNDFRRVTGINPDALGERSEVRSGVGIARKQQMTEIIVAPVFDNFRRTRIILAKVILEMVRQYWTEEMVFYVTDDLQSPRKVALNENSDQAKRIKEGIYDVIVEDMPDTTTMQQEGFQVLSQSLPQILQFGPAWAEVLIEISDIPKKEAYIDKIRKMSQPPPAEPKISVSLQWSELIPEEKASFAQKMGMPELAQFEAQNGTGPAHLVKTQADIAKEKQKAQSEQMKMRMEMEKGKMELQSTAAKNQMEIQHAHEKHQVDMAKANLDVEKAFAMAAAQKAGGGEEEDG